MEPPARGGSRSLELRGTSLFRTDKYHVSAGLYKCSFRPLAALGCRACGTLPVALGSRHSMRVEVDAAAAAAGAIGAGCPPSDGGPATGAPPPPGAPAWARRAR